MMRHLPTIRDTHLFIIARADTTIYAILGQPFAHTPCLKLYDYAIQHHSLQAPLARTKKFCHSFCTKNSAHHGFSHIALMAPLIEENCFILTKASPQPEDFPATRTNHKKWHYTYLHALDEGKHHFYACAIAPSLLFSASLPSLLNQIHPATVTTGYLAMLTAYKVFHGAAFRPSQLATDMMRTNYNLETLFTPDTLARLLSIPSTLPVSYEQDKETLAALIGLFHFQRTV